MSSLLKKLNYKDQDKIFILNSPTDPVSEIAEMKDTCVVQTQLPHETQAIQFVLVFVTMKEEIELSIQKIFPLLEGDSILWYAYPKGTSKKYKCDFNRDNGWKALGNYNLEPVRQVAIDEDWSALRFRKVEFIKKLTRNEALILSDKGKAKKNEEPIINK